jgi:tRNA threonylcarbamoyladenosine biosynthesis protein TsaB
VSPPRPLAIAIEASTRAPSIAIQLGDQVLEERLAGDAPHASDLLPALERLLARIGAAPRDIERIVVGLGPGSYTGVRVGVATALGLARGSGAALRGVASMEALAWGELEPGQTGSVLLDARASELYFATYRRSADALEVLTAPCITTRAELPSLLVPHARLFADPDALRAADLETRTDLQLARNVVPRASALLDLGLRRFERDGPQPAAALEPLYLRAFAAKSRRR